MDSSDWQHFAAEGERKLLELCSKLPWDRVQRPQDLPQDLLLYRSPKLSVYYAPFGLQRPKIARVFLAGLTPGFAQARRAYDVYQAAQGRLDFYESHFIREVVFAGPTRKNLIHYLNELGVHKVLGLESAELLFTARQDLLAAYSILRYPVFVGSELKNYGGSDALQRDPWLQSMIRHLFWMQVQRQDERTLFVPLGKYPARGFRELAALDPSLERRTLFGFPHTSGSNGHRHGQFAAGRAEFLGKVQAWASSLHGA